MNRWKSPIAIIVGYSTVQNLHGKSTANKISKDNKIFVMPLPRART